MPTPQSVLVDAVKIRPKRADGGRFARNPLARQMKLTVNTRQQTPAETRHYKAAFALLVAEIVRHELELPEK